MSIKGFEEKKSNTIPSLVKHYLELGDTQLLKESDKAMGKTKMSEPEPPAEIE